MEGLVYLAVAVGPWLAAAALTLLVAAPVLLLSRRLGLGGLGWAVALLAGLAAGAVPPALNRAGLARDLAALEADSLRPGVLALPPGALLHLADGNYAGITCRGGCGLADLPFVTGYHEAGPGALIEPSGAFRSPADLWLVLEGAPDRAAPFPYRYLFLSIPAWQLPEFPTPDGAYRRPHWPESVHGVHMLFVLPEDGRLDLAAAKPLYRRFNIQAGRASFPLWGLVSETVQLPPVGEIVADLARISAAAGE